MQCMIPGSNVKVFGRSIHCLSKIGEDLYIEPLDDGLALRTVNSSRSAYGCFSFAPSFFLSYANGSLGHEGPEDDNFRCRITMKSCLSIFKSLYTLEKSVDKCQMYLDQKECRLVFLLHCKHGIVKTFNLTYQETETLQAVYSRDLCPNRIVAHAKTLAEVISGFHTSQEEITLNVNPQQVSFKNYTEDEPDPNKVVHSEMFLSPSEFDDYTIGVDAEVTFCLKELRAVLTFSDAAGLPVSVHFETSGKPIVFAMESEQTLEATFVLATLADFTSSQRSSSQQKMPIASQHTSITQQRKAARKNQSAKKPPETEENFPEDLNNQTSFANPDRDHVSLGEGDSIAKIPARLLHLSTPVTSHQPAIRGETSKETVQKPTNKRDVRKPANKRSVCESTSGQALGSEFDNLGSKPNRTLLADLNDGHGERDPSNVRSEGEDYDFVPGTPPSKKFKSMFFGTSQQESQTSQPKVAVVLCNDTDDDASN